MIYTFGGERASHQGDAGVYENHERYDAATNAWASLEPLPTPRHGIGVTAIGGKVYVIGGGPHTGFAQTDVVEVFTP
jgi:N-acetylneuraminic acid mutarotase